MIREISMTGEITLSGKILPVGGIKEKAIAAKIHGYCFSSFLHKYVLFYFVFSCSVKEIILPKANESEWSLDIPDFVKQDLKVHFVDTYAEMFEVAFGFRLHSVPLFDRSPAISSTKMGGGADYVIRWPVPKPGSEDDSGNSVPGPRV